MKTKKLISAIIALAMVLSVVPFAAFADETVSKTSWYSADATDFTITTA